MAQQAQFVVRRSGKSGCTQEYRGEESGLQLPGFDKARHRGFYTQVQDSKKTNILHT